MNPVPNVDPILNASSRLSDQPFIVQSVKNNESLGTELQTSDR
jgi:hypothetical protein